MVFLLSAASPLMGLVWSLIVGAVSALMIVGGRHMIKTKTAGARKLERLMADSDGQIHGTMAVLKGYIFFLGGIVLALMPAALLLISVYGLIFGPIDLGRT